VTESSIRILELLRSYLQGPDLWVLVAPQPLTSARSGCSFLASGAAQRATAATRHRDAVVVSARVERPVTCSRAAG
jgi:hypothetical protein